MRLAIWQTWSHSHERWCSQLNYRQESQMVVVRSAIALPSSVTYEFKNFLQFSITEWFVNAGDILNIVALKFELEMLVWCVTTSRNARSDRIRPVCIV